MNITNIAPSAFSTPATTTSGGTVSTSPSSASTTTTSIPPKILTQSDFVKLLTVELQNQDPLQPMDDTSSIAQMTQFSALDQSSQTLAQMTAMRADQSKATAASYLGRQVTLTDSSNNIITGPVTAVDTSSTTPQIEVNGNLYPLSSVTKVEPYNPPSTTPATTTTPPATTGTTAPTAPTATTDPTATTPVTTTTG